ncbi:MAG: ABC transporter permease [Peptococcaceae bacterium]|jgi:peptide/nickel transport system permease protein|nr:ABC transporter permease [Peptococcaceae bacterium]
MARYLLRRVLWGMLTLFLAVTLTFLILRVMPSDPVSVMVDSRMTRGDIEALTREFGLDMPLTTQYARYLANLCRGQLGISFATRQPVSVLLAERLPWTFLLNLSALTLALALGVWLGQAAAKRRDTWLDWLIHLLAALGGSIFVPSLGLALLYLLGVKFPLLPIGGTHTPGVVGLAYAADVARHLLLPTAVLVLVTWPHYALHMRASLLEILRADYLRTARSKGMRESRALWRHGVRNALIPTVNISGLLLGSLSGGSILAETIFSYPGVGRLIYEAVGRLDYPVLQGAFLTLAAIVILLGILTDLLYICLEPRIRLGAER